MVYKVSKVSNKIYNENNIEVVLDTNTEEGIILENWLRLGNEPIIFDGTSEEIAEQELEQQKILKQQQYEELLPTDWYVVRFMETGVEIPEDILKLRKQIREKY